MSQHAAEEMLKKTGILSMFDLVQGVKEYNDSKPSPHMILNAMTHLDFKPNQTWMIGDSPLDILAGKNAKVHTCAICYTAIVPRAILAYEPTRIISTFAEILEVI